MGPPITLLCQQRLAFLIILTSLLILGLLPSDTESSEQFQQYLVCKDPKSKLCLIWVMQVQEALAILRKNNSIQYIKQNCGLGNLKDVPIQQKYLTIARLSDNYFHNVVCEKIKVIELESSHLALLVQRTSDRVRRQAGYSPRGRYRGQTQSQYLAVDRGGGKDDGKAEAHSAADSSRASVSGSSGMGQAQSQSMYDPSCDDCVGRSEIEAESLKRRPSDSGHPGAPNVVSNGGGEISGVSDGYIPGKHGVYGVGENVRPGSNIVYGSGQVRPNENGNGLFGNKPNGLPDGSGMFKPNKDVSYNSNLGGLPTESGKGVFNSPSTHVLGPYQGTPPGELNYGINQGSPSISGGYNPPYSGTPPQKAVFGSNQGSSPSVGTNTPGQGGSQNGNGFPKGPISNSQGTINPNQSGLPNVGNFGQSGYPSGATQHSGAFGPSQQNVGTPSLPNYGTQNGNAPAGTSLDFNHPSLSNSGNLVPYYSGTPGGNVVYGSRPGGVPSEVSITHATPPGVISTGNVAPKQHGLPGSTGSIIPTQIGVSNGFGPYGPNTPGGNIQVSSNPLMQPGPYGINTATNWPHGTGSFTAPDGTTYYCCVVGPYNNAQHYKINAGGPGTSIPTNGPYGSGSVGEPQNLLATGTPYGISQGNYGNQLRPGSLGGQNTPTGQQDNQIPTNYAQGTYPYSHNGPYNPGNIGGQTGLSRPGTHYGPGSIEGQQNQGGISDQYRPATGGQYRPSDINGQYSPGGQYTPSGKDNQYTPGGVGNEYGPLGAGTQYVPGGANNQNNLGSTGGQFTPGGTGGHYGPGTTGGQYNPGGTGGQYNPGSTGGQYNPGSTGGQYNPGSFSEQYNPGRTNGQYIPGGTNGQYIPGRTNGQYTPGGPGGLQVTQGPNVQYGSGPPSEQYGPQKIDGQNALQGPREQFGLKPMISQQGPLDSNGQYKPGFITAQHGMQRPDGQYSPGAMPIGNGLKQDSQYISGLPAGQSGYNTPDNIYGSSQRGNAPSGTKNSYDGHIQPPGSIPAQNTGPNGQYGQRQNPNFYPQQYGNGIPGTGSVIGQDGNGPYRFNNQANLGQKVDYSGVPQNVIDPNSEQASIDGDDSEAEASVSQATNGTVATASSKGGNEKGRAQTHVHGAYTGSGSFSAQAEISGDNKAANSEVTGDKKGASSNAQGSGRNNKSQANVQLGSETGAVLTGSQSDGVMHSSNTQVQGSVKGGMADAQARGPGSTSSQAQIGFTPYKEGDKSHDLQGSPFTGGGTAAAQSSGRTGSSQSQLRGTFKYGITYNGAAQAGASLNKDAIFSNRLAFDKIDVYDKNNKNINVNTEKSLDSVNNDLLSTDKPLDQENSNVSEKLFETDKHTLLRNPTEVIPSTDIPFEITTTTDTTKEVSKDVESEYSDHIHADHHRNESQPHLPTLVPPVESRRSFPSTYGTNSGDYEYTTDKEDNPPEDYDVDDGFAPEGNDATEGEQGEYTNYNEFSRDPDATHQSLQNPKRRGVEVRQTTGGNTQHIVLGSLSNQDAEITQKNSEHPDEGKVYQPGERVPGTGGYTIPIGFTGSVKSVASKDNTFVIGSKESPSQAQTVSLTPGSGKIKYTYPSTYTRNIHPKDLRSLYHPKSDDNNRYVSVSKSVTRDLDGENNIRKQYSHTYFTKSSSCGYFSFTCTMVSGAEGRKKVCKPKIPTNPDGSPMRC